MSFISVLTDFGIDQEYVGVCKAVMLSIHPGIAFIDISHTVPPYDIGGAALMLKNFVRFSPVGVHVVVVDPGVGTERRGIAIETERGDFLVGPDNGVLMWAAETLIVKKVVALDNKEYMLKHVSASFHGRDIFAPAAAHLSAGVQLENLGSLIGRKSLHPLPHPAVRRDTRAVTGHVLRIDRFGNIQTTIDAQIIRERKEVGIEIGGHELEIPVVRTFDEVPKGELLLYEDSDGLLTLALNQGNAAKTLEIKTKYEIKMFL